MRHRRQNENVTTESTRKLQREGEVTIGEIKEEKKHEETDWSGNEGRTYIFELSSLTDGKTGEIVIQTKPEWAPFGVEQFHELLDNNFYQDAKFFRVVEDFVVQFGIPAIPSSKK